jgi:hypothetical protein
VTAGHAVAGRRFGVELEFAVLEGGRQLDFSRLATLLAVPGQALHPTRRDTFLTDEGVALSVDGVVAEIATPPIEIGPGFAARLSDWVETGAAALARWVEGRELVGGSSHLNVEVDAAVNDRVALAYTRVFAPAMMLMMDRRSSPGILVRPRPGRTELCGEFIEGRRLEVAAIFAAASVRAVERAVTACPSAPKLPVPLDFVVEPGRRRHGWYVDRNAFGTDLYDGLRRTQLRDVRGRTITAQRFLERCWSAARPAAEFASPEDLALIDAIVAGSSPLPSEGELFPAVRPQASGDSLVGRALQPRGRPGFLLVPKLATWDLVVFAVEGATRAAALSVPYRDLERTLGRLDRGELDADILDFLRSPASGHVLSSVAQTGQTALWDGVSASEALLPADRVGVGAGEVTAERPDKRQPEERARTRTRGGRLAAALATLALVALVVAVALPAWASHVVQWAPGADCTSEVTAAEGGGPVEFSVCVTLSGSPLSGFPMTAVVTTASGTENISFVTGSDGKASFTVDPGSGGAEVELCDSDGCLYGSVTLTAPTTTTTTTEATTTTALSVTPTTPLSVPPSSAPPGTTPGGSPWGWLVTIGVGLGMVGAGLVLIRSDRGLSSGWIPVFEKGNA